MISCPFPTEYLGEYVSRDEPFKGDFWTFTFSNGYGASVIRNKHSYGYPYLWELAVLKDKELCYTTPITSDVIGYLTEDEVAWFIEKIASLKP